VRVSIGHINEPSRTPLDPDADAMSPSPIFLAAGNFLDTTYFFFGGSRGGLMEPP